MLPKWTVSNNYKLAEIEESTTTSIDLPLETLTGVTTKIISGSLPLGLRLENNRIIGTPFTVDRPVSSKFVIRASTIDGIADRTFFILVEGADDPQWITPEGRLPVGPNGVLFILDNSLIDFQLLATDPDLPAGDSLEFRLTGGELPPGITLTLDGRLTGIVDPLLALEVNVVNGNYDENPLDVLPYDFSANIAPGSRTPRKLNREFFFRVTAYDNVSSVTRQFQIFVVGDDFAKADNTIMKAGDGVFTADFTFLRVPLWLTSSNLGVRRANNYLTIFLDAFDANTLTGALEYFLEPINDDGSPSVVPPGLLLDSKTGELAGRVPYQPAVTRDYKFTVNALRFNAELGLFTVFGTFLEDTLANRTSTVKIGKVPRTLFEGLTELEQIVGRTITIENKLYNVVSVNESNLEFDTLTLDRAVEPLINTAPMVFNKNIFQDFVFDNDGFGNPVLPSYITQPDFFFINTVSQTDKEFYFRKFLRYADAEAYRIDEIYPYIKWEITAESNNSIYLIGNNDSSLIESVLESTFSEGNRTAYVNVERNSFDQVISIKLIIPATAQNRNKTYIEGLFETQDSSPLTANKIVEFDRVKLDQTIFGNLNNDLSGMATSISLGLTRGSSFSQTLSRVEEEVASKKKTFTIRLLGEIDSVITWITPSNLETLRANRISTLFVKAITTVQDSLIKYSVIEGRLPPGLTLLQDGEIIGKVPVFGTVENPGLIRFVDNNSPTTFDFGATTFDREYSFTVLAKDRFEYSAIERRFTIVIDDEDNLNYSNIFCKPFLTNAQREKFLNLVDDSQIFPPSAIYRPSDPNFGIQKTLKCLVYAGIENLNLEYYVSAISKNHKRTNFYFGDLKTAVAKTPGTNDILYEVVYVELIDRKKSTQPAQEKIKITSKNKITVDSVAYETQDDNSVSPLGTIGLTVLTNVDDVETYFLLANTVETNNNGNISLVFDQEIAIQLASENLVNLEASSIDELVDQNLLPDRYRPTPKANTIKADSNAITIDQNSDNTKYLSNIDTMRQRIKNIEVDNKRAVSNREFLPLWMQTAQENSLNEIDYVLALPIVYTKPGQSQTIKENIINSKFDFKQLNFDIDRYIIDNTKDQNREQYILFANYQFNV
jgi:hypothetical protein